MDRVTGVENVLKETPVSGIPPAETNRQTEKDVEVAATTGSQSKGRRMEQECEGREHTANLEHVRDPANVAFEKLTTRIQGGDPGGAIRQGGFVSARDVPWFKNHPDNPSRVKGGEGCSVPQLLGGVCTKTVG